nr:MAG TPA: hypothetical protein [Caudoviricetes sp.]
MTNFIEIIPKTNFLTNQIHKNRITKPFISTLSSKNFNFDTYLTPKSKKAFNHDCILKN